MIALLIVCSKGDPTLTHLCHRQFRTQESMQGITANNIHRNRFRTLACKRRKEETKLRGMDLSLYCVTRALHLDVVPNMTPEALIIRSLRHFTARRGLPAKIISDNGTTFQAAIIDLPGVRVTYS